MEEEKLAALASELVDGVKDYIENDPELHQRRIVRLKRDFYENLLFMYAEAIDQGTTDLGIDPTRIMDMIHAFEHIYPFANPKNPYDELGNPLEGSDESREQQLRDDASKVRDMKSEIESQRTDFEDEF